MPGVELSYSDTRVDFSSDVCIHPVRVKFLRYTASTGLTHPEDT